MGMHDLFEFELVPVSDGAIIRTDAWVRIQHLLLEMQPTTAASLVGDPPHAIKILAHGGAEIAPGLLKKVSDLAGTPLRMVPC